RFLQELIVKKNQSIERNGLGSSSDIALHDQMGEKARHVIHSEFGRMPLAMKKNKALDPMQIPLDRALAVTSHHHEVAERGQKRRTGHRDPSLEELKITLLSLCTVMS